MLRRTITLALLLVASGCASTLKSSRVRPDYEAEDKARLKRLVVLTAPAPEGQEPVGELWSRIARRYVNQKRHFIVKAHATHLERPTPDSLKQLCAEAAEGLEGVLWLEPVDVRRMGTGPEAGVEAGVRAQLTRCADGQEVWRAEAAGSWPSEDPELKESVELWTQGLDASVLPYAAPTFRLLRPTLDSLPEPTPLVTDEEVMEKGEAEAF